MSKWRKIHRAHRIAEEYIWTCLDPLQRSMPQHAPVGREYRSGSPFDAENPMLTPDRHFSTLAPVKHHSSEYEFDTDSSHVTIRYFQTDTVRAIVCASHLVYDHSRVALPFEAAPARATVEFRAESTRCW